MKRHASAERLGIPFDSLAVDIDDGLKERSRYNRMSNGFQCKKCGRNYPSRYHLAKHYKHHEQQENETELNLNDDADAAADGAAAADDDHSIIMKRRPYVRSHPHQPKTEFICEACDVTFKRYVSLKEHIASKHASKGNFTCSKCNRTYPNRYYLQKHMKRHQGGKLKEEVARLEENLIERNQYHRAHSHRPTSNFECDFCHKTLSSYYSIREHMLSKHRSKKKAQTKTKTKPNPCPKCGKKFLSEKRLERHNCAMLGYVSHASKPKAELKHMCSTCGRLFVDRSSLKEHEETHLGIMSSCELCGRVFLHKNYLRKHIRTVHSRERPFSCNVDGCEWTFAYQQCLKRHQARRHGMVTNRNACPICSKEFPESTYHLKRHLKAHANNTAKEYFPEPKPTADPPVI